MNKLEMLKGPSCLTRANDDEPVFLLRANDELASEIVEMWARAYYRQKSAQGSMSSAQNSKFEEALTVARAMKRWREEQAFDFAAHLRRQREFSRRTFGPGERTKGVVDHIRKELDEVLSSVGSGKHLEEWIDVVILALDGAWRSGAAPGQIIRALIAKQTKNEGRVWPDWRTTEADKAIEHVRSEDAPEPGR